MNKKLYTILAILAFTCSIFVACGDDDNSSDVDEEWKAFNDSIYNAVGDTVAENIAAGKVKSDSVFLKRTCLTGNGDIYYKLINDFKITPPPSADMAKFGTKVTIDGTPYFNDSVTVRYMGWFYYENTEGIIVKHVFDGTEESFNKQNGAGFNINKLTSGFSTMLQHMKVNDQVQICVPYQLAYGAYGNSTIKGYTTLFFDIMLLRIYPVNPNEFPDANTGK